MKRYITGLCTYIMCEKESQTAFQERTTVIMTLLKGKWTIPYSPGRRSRRDLVNPRLPGLKERTNDYTRALPRLTLDSPQHCDETNKCHPG